MSSTSIVARVGFAAVRSSCATAAAPSSRRSALPMDWRLIVLSRRHPDNRKKINTIEQETLPICFFPLFICFMFSINLAVISAYFKVKRICRNCMFLLIEANRAKFCCNFLSTKVLMKLGSGIIRLSPIQSVGIPADSIRGSAETS